MLVGIATFVLDALQVVGLLAFELLVPNLLARYLRPLASLLELHVPIVTIRAPTPFHRLRIVTMAISTIAHRP